MIYVATAYWCNEHWVIAAGHDKAAVTRDADAHMAKYTAIDDNGPAEDYIVEEVEESK